jgi:hypothetical protein
MCTANSHSHLVCKCRHYVEGNNTAVKMATSVFGGSSLKAEINCICLLELSHKVGSLHFGLHGTGLESVSEDTSILFRVL